VKARVYVTLKPGILDPQGQAVQKALARLGFGECAGVRIGKYVEVDLEGVSDAGEAKARVTAMCEKLIANPVTENFRVEIGE